MTGPLLLVLSLTLAAVLANFVAMVLALKAMRRAQEAASESANAAAARAQEALAATLAEARAGTEAASELTRQSHDLARQTIEAARRAVEESNELTRRSVEAAERALDFSRRAFEVAHQPSLHVVKVETISGSSSVDTVLTARVSLRNTGTSDAHDVMITGRFNVGPVNIDEVAFPATTGGATQGFVGPDLIVHGTIQQSLTFELRDANARSGRLFVVCCVRYGDDYGAVHLAVFVRVWSGGQWVAVREKRKRISA